MTKSDLISSIAEQFPQLTHADTALSIQTILNSMTDALVSNDRIEVRGFGSFSINIRPARIARNPRTGDKVNVAAKRAPHFKPGIDLKKRVM